MYLCKITSLCLLIIFLASLVGCSDLDHDARPEAAALLGVPASEVTCVVGRTFHYCQATDGRMVTCDRGSGPCIFGTIHPRVDQ
jgi:hypothetical protein